MDEPVWVRAGDDGVVVVGGEVDAFASNALDDALRAAVVGRTGDVIVDLSQVTFMDSGGLNIFVRHYKPLDVTGRRLVLRHPQRSVARALEVAGLTSVFDVEMAP